MKLDRWSAYKFRNGKIARNRVVVPAMASQTADPNGLATSTTLAHYERLSRAGAGILFVEYSFIHQSGKSEVNQLGAHNDETIPGLKSIARSIRSSGTLAGLQLVHGGGKTTEQITGQPLLGASEIRVPVKGWEPPLPKALPTEKIPQLIEWYLQAAERANSAGFDLIELHAAHGYGLNQWLSPLTNQRSDLYGGEIQNRARLLFEIVTAIKPQFPHLLLSVRIPAQDHAPGGLQIDEMQWVTEHLERRGVDLINVSSGIGGWRRPEGKTGEGYLVADAKEIKSATAMPVIGVGGIETGSTIDRMLEQHSLDFAAVGRAILKDPTEWSEENLGHQHNHESFAERKRNLEQNHEATLS